MRNINFFGSLSEFKDSIGMKQPRRGMQADANRKTAEAMKYAQQDLVDAIDYAIPGQPFPPRIQKRLDAAADFLYENRLYKTQPKRVKQAKKNK
jgi:hypothetical protein